MRVRVNGDERELPEGTTVVEVYATVSGAGGHVVTNLPRDAFRVTEDGVERPVEVFAAGDVPLSLAVAVVHSFSVPRQRLDYAVNAVVYPLVLGGFSIIASIVASTGEWRPVLAVARPMERCPL